MSTDTPPPVVLPEIDTPPTSGVFVDHEEFYTTATPQEIADGLTLGAQIDVDDDTDNGGVA